ncbi:MAG: hypothetical protein ACRCZI_07820, partial [Cetobacterium sp.]
MEKPADLEPIVDIMLESEMFNKESTDEEATKPEPKKSVKTKKAKKITAHKGKQTSTKVSKPESEIRQTRATARAMAEKEMTSAMAETENETVSATRPIAPRKPNSKGKPKELNPEWHQWVFHGFDDSGCDEANAERMFHHLLKVRPKNCCNRVNEFGIKPLTCKCLKRIATLLSTATPAEQEEWKVLFRKFSSVLKSIATEGDSVSTLLKFLYEFQHT